MLPSNGTLDVEVCDSTGSPQLQMLPSHCVQLPLAVSTFNVRRFYLKAAKANENMEKTAKYLAVLTLMGHQQLCYWPSTVAAALVIIASIATDQDAFSHLAMKIHAINDDKDLPECIKSMEWLVKYL
ncbi:hypothetical protein SASPL_130611 [Salvia splendens]|uniref:Cyclin C-terminal domain-containing protein n=1 Tax=Salvia splendens TaxID=180675 RepID=A0A8X8X8H9_SALSN|nr:hypothetical protein SASPL_130611 [Salvia splendens]